MCIDMTDNINFYYFNNVTSCYSAKVPRGTKLWHLYDLKNITNVEIFIKDIKTINNIKMN